MESTEDVELVRRTLALLREKTTDMIEREGSVPVDLYVSEARLTQERALLRETPVVIGHSSQLREPGDYLTHDASGTPLLVCRGRDGALTAFVNVCRHRGTRLVMEPQGQRRHAFVCPYHGWTYDDSGRLRNVPQEWGFPSAPTANVSLMRAFVEERHGLLFASAAPVLSIEGFLGSIDPRLAALTLDEHVLYRPEEFRFDLNWKIAIEVFLEGYHLKYAHAKSIYPLFFDNTGICDRFDPHIRFVFPKRTLVELEGQEPSSWRLRQHANILYFIFPNTLVLIEPDFVSVSTVFPLGTDRTLFKTFHLLPSAPENEKQERFWHKNVEILLSAVREDLALGASIQQGIRAGANTHFRHARYEQGLGYFHESLNAALAAAERSGPRG